MMKKALLLMAFAAGAVACSSASTTSLSDKVSGDDDDSGSSQKDDSGSGSGGDDTTSGDPTLRDDSGIVPPSDAGGRYDSSIPDGGLDVPVTLKMDAFTVNAGQEVYKCQNFGNPWTHDVDIVKLDGYMDPGSHHFFLFNMDATTGRTTKGPIENCAGNGIEFHPFPYLSQKSGHYVVNFPQENMGYPMVKANGFMMNAHYLNTSSMPITPTVQITIWPAKPGIVTTRVGSIFLNNTFFSVPNGIPKSAPNWYSKTMTPISATDYTIITNWSHMHQWATDFQASINNNVFYEEPQWDEPHLITAGTGPDTSPMLPLKVKAGTPITWQCKYYNDTGATLNFGDSAASNVMCIYIGQYYPADTTQPSYPDVVSVLN